MERGSSSKGTGRLNGFVLLPETNFTSSVYTDLYLSAAGAAGLSRFEDAYKDCIAALTDRLEETAEIRNPQRLEELRSEIDEQLDQARDEVEKGEQELADGQRQLEDAREQYQEGVKALEEKEAEYESALSASKARLDEARQQLEDSLAQLNSQEQQLNDAKTQLDAGQEELQSRTQQWQQGQEKLKELEAGIVQLQQTLAAPCRRERLRRRRFSSSWTRGKANTPLLRRSWKAESRRWIRRWPSGRKAVPAMAGGSGRPRGGKAQYESGVISYEESLQQWESARRTVPVSWRKGVLSWKKRRKS